MVDAPPGPCILLVDDEPDLLDVLANGLRRGIPDVRILTAPNGRAGLEVLGREKIDVILSDHRMPLMEGVDFLIAARKVAPSATRMMLTAYGDPQMVARNVNEAHIRHFFTKPVRLKDVVEVMRQVLDERRQALDRDRDLARALREASPSAGAPRPNGGSGPLL